MQKGQIGSRNTKDVSILQLINLSCDLLEGVAFNTNKEKYFIHHTPCGGS